MEKLDILVIFAGVFVSFFAIKVLWGIDDLFGAGIAGLFSGLFGFACMVCVRKFRGLK